VFGVGAFLALAQEREVGALGVVLVVDEELLEVSLLGALVVEEQLPEHLVERQAQLIGVHHVLVLLDGLLPHDFVVLLHDFLLLEFVEALAHAFVLIVDVGEVDGALFVEGVGHAGLAAAVEDVGQLRLGGAEAVAELVEDRNLHGALVEFAVAADQLLALRDLVVAGLGLHLLECGVFGLEGAVDLQEDLKHAQVVQLLKLFLLERVRKLVARLVGVDGGQLLDNWLLRLPLLFLLVFERY